MAAPPLMRSLSTRTVKKLEKPRPLKTSASQSKISSPSTTQIPVHELMTLVETVRQNLEDKNYNESLTLNIALMHSKLKQHGQQLESIYKDQLDRAFVIFRNGCQDDGLQYTTRLLLLELIEHRANQWSGCNNTQIYYSAKMAATEVEATATSPDINTNTIPMSTPTPPAPPVLSPGEVLKTSGKFPKPTKIPGKNYCKDEVVIRNSDSGKVMGIKGRRVHMIEELSETIISFQRVNPGAKERLVQITGPSEDKISHARQLMEDTIRRNASPVREGGEREHMGGSSSSLNSSASDEASLSQPGSRRSLLHSYSNNDASLGEYKYTVTVAPKNALVKIVGLDYESVRNCRLVLEEFYNVWLQKNYIGGCYVLDEDVFVDPLPQEVAMLRLNSVEPDFDPNLGYQPMFPMAQPERRPVLGRSNSIPISAPLSTQQAVGVTRKYSREFLLSCAVSQHSRATPPNWENIVIECPAIVKKATPPFDPTAYLTQLPDTSTAVISSNQLTNDPDSD